MSARVLILGTGFAGLTVARALARRCHDVTITAVNRENYSLFTPMLPEVASGSIEPRHIAQPFRTALPEVTFALGEIEGIDFAGRAVATRHPVTDRTTTIPYDHLVIALGSVSSTHGVPGAGEHSLALRTIDDAIRLRNHLTLVLEAAAVASETDRPSLLTIAVVGGGFAGVEAAGELQTSIQTALRQYRGLDPAMIRVVLVAGSDRLLEQLPQRFGLRAQEMLEERHVEIVLNDDAASVDAGGVTLKSGRRYAAKTVVWSGGVCVPQFVQELDLPHTEHHAIRVNADLSVPERPGVWALGDCAGIPKPQGGFYPQTAQDAVREGTLLAHNISATLHRKKTRPFHYRSLGMMASIGGREGLADVRGRLISGFPAWLLWRSYYWSRLSGAYRKTRVALDWSLDVPFQSDIASIR